MSAPTTRSHGADAVLPGTDKALPPQAAGLSDAEFLATRPHLRDFWTPVVTVDRDALEHNLRLMQHWAESRGFQLMPHGKTTMAPALWRAQLDAGARGITLATTSQVRTALRLGFTDLMLANELVAGPALRWIAEQLADPSVRFTCWADSLAGVDRMEAALQELDSQPVRPVEVCVELGAPGARTGARSGEDAVALAARIARSPVLRLAGVAGYEGAVAHERSAADEATVVAYLEQMVELHRRLAPLYDEHEVMVTAGGSVYFDLVAEVFGPARREFPGTAWVLRAGAYLIHDHGHYAQLSPLVGGEDGLRPAVVAMAQVVSRPEPRRAYLEAGKRDLAHDAGLPVPLGYAAALGEPWAPLPGAHVTELNDQHAYVDLGENTEVAVGDVVMLGMSHPCTMFDRWRTLPEVDAHGNVVGLIRTYF